MSKLALIFPGQGSQFAGMGVDFPEAKALFGTIFDSIGIDLENIMITGEFLQETVNAQLAIFSHSVLAFQALMNLKVNYTGIAGFSLGEYSGLYAAKILDFNHALELIYQRANLMQTASKKYPGMMAAVLGLDRLKVESTLLKVRTGKVYVANINGYEQIVISGNRFAFEEASHLLKACGAKRIIPLSVSGAFHSPLMAEAADQLEIILKDFVLFEPAKPVYLNVTGQRCEIQKLKKHLVSHLIKPVEFTRMIETMKNDGFTHMLEIGPGKVLANLIKKMDSNIQTYSFEKFEQLNDLKGWLNDYGFIE